MVSGVLFFLHRDSTLRLVRGVDVGLAGKAGELDDENLVEGDAFDPLEQLVVEPAKLVCFELDILFC
jgi:hypothetical protein